MNEIEREREVDRMLKPYLPKLRRVISLLETENICLHCIFTVLNEVTAEALEKLPGDARAPHEQI